MVVAEPHSFLINKDTWWEVVFISFGGEWLLSSCAWSRLP